MRRKTLVCVDREREFPVHELLFSSTDRRGVIQYGNEVFVRVSGYDLAGLIGKPHSVLRHPDMPASVFRVFWNMLNAGDSIAAYVKNRSKDGGYYWVMAVASPIADGFLSVRMKPTSELLPIVAEVYARVLADEQDAATQGMSKDEVIEIGLASLMSEMNALGFATYLEFMHHAMVQESMQRESTLPLTRTARVLTPQQRLSASEQEIVISELSIHNATCDELLSSMLRGLTTLDQANRSFLELCELMQVQSKTIEMAAMNAKVSANTTTLEAISDELATAESDNSRTISKLTGSVGRVSTSLTRLAFDISVANLQCEIASQFLREIHSDQSIDSESLLKVLLEQSDVRLRKLLEELSQAGDWFGEIEELIDRVQRNAKTLRFIRMAGVTESSQLANDHPFVGLFNDVKQNILEAFVLCRQLREQVCVCARTMNELSRHKLQVSNRLNQISAAVQRLSLNRDEMLRPLTCR